MITTKWKSRAELEHVLRNVQKVAIFSCGSCANIIDTGGPTGINVMKKLLVELGKEVVLAEVAIACCAEELMRPLFKVHRKELAGCDAVVIISCAGGVKSAVLSDPGAPVIAALDTLGSAPISFQDSPVARSLCTTCGHCVLSFTGGICPISDCPTRRKYGPCEKSPKEGGVCGVFPERDCVWVEIAKRGDLQALKELERIHKQDDESMYIPAVRIAPAKPARRSEGKLVTRISPWSRFKKLVMKKGLHIFTYFYTAVIKKYKNAQDIQRDARI